MGICHGYLRVPKTRFDQLFAALDRVMAGEPPRLLGEFMDFELLEDEFGPVELVTRTRGLLRKTRVTTLTPLPEHIVQHFLMQLEEDAGTDLVSVDKLFSRWHDWDLQTEVPDDAGFDKAVWGTTSDPIPKAYRGEGYALIEQSAWAPLARTARALVAANESADDYVTGGLTGFAELLESAGEHDYVVATWS